MFNVYNIRKSCLIIFHIHAQNIELIHSCKLVPSKNRCFKIRTGKAKIRTKHDVYTNFKKMKKYTVYTAIR